MKNSANTALKLRYPRPRTLIFQPAAGKRVEGREDYIPPFKHREDHRAEVVSKPNGALALVLDGSKYVDLPIGTKVLTLS